MKKIVLPLTATAAAALLVATAIMSYNRSSQATENYRITTIEQGGFNFRPTAQDFAAGKVFEDECPGKVCACDSDVQRVQLGGSGGRTDTINAALDKLAAPKCDMTLATTISKPQVTFISPEFVSVVNERDVLGHGANGSCNGTTQAVTFDRDTAKPLLLKDVVAPQDMPAVIKVLAKDITDRQRKETPELFSSESEVREKIAADQGKLGLFIHGGKIMAQVDNFLFSCAEGHSFPSVVPVQYVQNNKLLKAAQSGIAP